MFAYQICPVVHASVLHLSVYTFVQFKEKGIDLVTELSTLISSTGELDESRKDLEE